MAPMSDLLALAERVEALDGPVRYYTEDEMRLIRQHKAAGHALARRVIQARGVTLHPKIAALRARAAMENDNG